MHTVNKWVRQLHRWLVIPFFLAIIYLLINTLLAGASFVLPVWLNIVAIGSLLLLLLTGLYLFAQHYMARWRRVGRAR